MTTSELISVIVSLVGALIGLISFFAAIVFYVQGNKLNRQSEAVLSEIKAKVSVIQGDYGRFVDKSFDLAAGNVGHISAKLSEQMDILQSSLKKSIFESIATLNLGEAIRPTSKVDQTLADLERRINRLIQEQVTHAKEEAIRIVEVGGIKVSEEAIEHLIMRSLQYGSVLKSSIRSYLHSHCLEVSLTDLTHLLENMQAKALVVADDELNLALTDKRLDKTDLFWRLTDIGKKALAKRLKG